MSRFKEDFFVEPQWPTPSLDDVSPVDKSYTNSIQAKEECNESEERRSTLIDQTLYEYSIISICLSDNLDNQIKAEQSDTVHPLQKDSYFYLNKLQVKQEIKQEVKEEVSMAQDIKFEEISEICQKTASNHKHFNHHKQNKFKYNILNKEIKQFLVKQTQFEPISAVAKQYGVSINNLCRWKKSCERRSGAGRKVTNMEMETKIIQWILQKQKERTSEGLTRKEIQLKAKEFSGDRYFKASKGWFQRFAKRNKSLNLLPKAQSLSTHKEIKKLEQQHQLSSNHCYHERKNDNNSMLSRQSTQFYSSFKANVQFSSAHTY